MWTLANPWCKIVKSVLLITPLFWWNVSMSVCSTAAPSVTLLVILPKTALGQWVTFIEDSKPYPTRFQSFMALESHATLMLGTVRPNGSSGLSITGLVEHLRLDSIVSIRTTTESMRLTRKTSLLLNPIIMLVTQVFIISQWMTQMTLPPQMTSIVMVHMHLQIPPACNYSSR